MFPWRSLRIRSSPFSSDGFFSIFRFYKEDKADQIDEYRAEREKDGEEKTAPRFYKAFRENPAEQMRAANFQQKDLRDDQRAQECGKRYPPALIQKRRLPGNFFIVDFVERQSDVRGTFRKLHLPRISPFFDDFPYVENPEHSVQTVEQQDIVIEIGNFLVQPTDDDFFFTALRQDILSDVFSHFDGRLEKNAFPVRLLHLFQSAVARRGIDLPLLQKYAGKYHRDQRRENDEGSPQYYRPHCDHFLPPRPSIFLIGGIDAPDKQKKHPLLRFRLHRRNLLFFQLHVENVG